MEMDLKNIQWGEFVIQDIFDIKIGKNVDGNKVNKKTGKIPYVTRKESDNGLDGFIDYNSNYININRPVITIGNETAEPFVQNYAFFTGTKVNILIPKHKTSKAALLFVAQSIKKHKSKYSYSFTINSTRLKRQIIQLPINSEGEPDYVFMEDYIQKIENRLIAKYNSFISLKINNLALDVKSINQINWGEFFIEDIAEIISGRDIYEAERIKGNTPYVSATAQNNGIGYYVGNENETLENNCLSVNRNGSVGYSFYHPYKALFSNDCRKLRLKHNSKFVGLFIARIITNQKEKYGYGYKMGTGRIKRQKIMLPVNEKNEPDYDFMENYMKRLELQKLSRYLELKHN